MSTMNYLITYWTGKSIRVVADGIRSAGNAAGYTDRWLDGHSEQSTDGHMMAVLGEHGDTVATIRQE